MDAKIAPSNSQYSYVKMYLKKTLIKIRNKNIKLHIFNIKKLKEK